MVRIQDRYEVYPVERRSAREGVWYWLDAEKLRAAYLDVRLSGDGRREPVHAVVQNEDTGTAHVVGLDTRYPTCDCEWGRRGGMCVHKAVTGVALEQLRRELLRAC